MYTAGSGSKPPYVIFTGTLYLSNSLKTYKTGDSRRQRIAASKLHIVRHYETRIKAHLASATSSELRALFMLITT